MNLRDLVEIVLVEPSESGNVGSCARALMNMGFSSFKIVNPGFDDFSDARTLAVHASQMLDNLEIFDTLEEALAQSSWVVGVSGRPRAHPERYAPIGPDTLVETLKKRPTDTKAALVFGTERTGLTSVQLGLCQDVLSLPTSERYPSLNLAHAVLLVAWEIRKAELGSEASPNTRDLVSMAEVNGLMEHVKHTLGVVGFLNPQNPRLIIDNLRKVFARANLDSRELKILRGIFHKVDVWIAQHGGPPTPNQERESKG